MDIQKGNAKLATATLQLITQQRNGEIIDQGLVKEVVDSFVSMGLDNGDPNKECLDIYKEQFEAPFLKTQKPSLPETLSLIDNGASLRLDLRVGGKYRHSKKIGSSSFGVLSLPR